MSDTENVEKQSIEDDPFAGAVMISSYSRAQALADGVLVDVDTIDPPHAWPGARAEAGMQHPVALTKRVYDECVAVNDRCDGAQSVAGRLWDVLWMAAMGVRRARGKKSDRLEYRLFVTRPATPAPGTEMMGDDSSAEATTLVFQVGPGDNGEPVITIMFPDED